jgi:hypothetical protein
VNTGFNYLPGWLYTPTAAAVPPQLTQAPYNTQPVLAYQTGLLFPYVKSMDVYWSPFFDRGPNSIYATSILPAGNQNALSSYIMNGSTCGFAKVNQAPHQTFKMSNLAFKSTCILLWEPDPKDPNTGKYSGAFNDGSSIPDKLGEAPAKIDGKGSLVLSMDASVRYMLYRDLLILMLSTGPNDIWYSPAAPLSGGYPMGQGN